MTWKTPCLAICGLLAATAVSLGQQLPAYPGQNPVNPYASYGPTAFSGQPYYQPMAMPMPMSPYGQPMMAPGYGPAPMPPFGQPMMAPGYGPTPPNATPYMPYAPNPNVPMQPAQPGGTPQQGSSEPYFVLPESAPYSKSPTGTGKPTSTQPEPRTTVRDSVVQLVDYITSDQNEPYTTYEGRRYASEQRQDLTRVWAQAGFVHAWVRQNTAPPLVTTGGANFGTLGQADTVVLLGNRNIAPLEFSGAQATIGMWLDQEKLTSLEASGLWLGQRNQNYRFASDAGGTPLLSRPIAIPGESVASISFPGALSGSFDVTASMEFLTMEMNLTRNIARVSGWSLDSLIGVRYAYLNDSLTMNQNLTALPGIVIPFQGNAAPAGSSVTIADTFNVTNRFYGGQVGARVGYAWRGLDVGLSAKLALGATSEIADINGFTILNGTTAAVGGILAQGSNIGRHSSTVFSVLPEFGATAGFQVTPRIRVFAAYALVYWNHMQRAAGQIDRRVDLTQVPVAGPGVYNPNAATIVPHYFSARTEFWVQAINVGIEIKY